MKKFPPHENPDGGAQNISPPGSREMGGQHLGGKLPPHPFWVFPPISWGDNHEYGGKMGGNGGEIMKFVPPHHFRFG